MDSDIIYQTFLVRFTNFLIKVDNAATKIDGRVVSIEDIRNRLLSLHTEQNDNAHPEWWAETAAIAMAIADRRKHVNIHVVARLLARKRVDYGCNNIVEFGQIGIAIRAMDKYHRIVNITKRDGETAVGESIDDAYVDIIGYCAVAYLYASDSWLDSTVVDI